MDWHLKTRAYLYGLSSAATTLGQDRRAFAERLLQAAGYHLGTIDWPALVAADAEAVGLDMPPTLPPLMPGATAGLFARQPLLRHPLSGATADLSSRVRMDAPAAYLDALTQAADSLQTAQDDRARFLTLWRGHWWRQPVLGAGLEPGLLDLLPPDPRAPLPSVWQHASLTAAFAGCAGDPALFTFTIASPQDFVATSRRTQDFWMGSFLLSWLSWAAMRAVAERCGPDALIYPDLKDQPLVDLWLQERHVPLPRPAEAALKIANFPNRFTALVPWNGADRLGPAAQEAIRASFQDIASRCLNALKQALRSREAGIPELAAGLGTVGGDTWNRIWHRQVEQLADTLGVYWTALRWDRAPGQSDPRQKAAATLEEQARLFGRLPLGGDPLGGDRPDGGEAARDLLAESPTVNLGMLYAPVSKLSARTLDTRKHLRNFTNPEHGEPGEKCSLCGTRQALHPDGAVGIEALRRFWERLKQLSVDTPKFKLQGRVRGGERLCAVCFTRRLAWEHAFGAGPLKDCVDQAESHLLFPSSASIATAPFKRAVLEGLADDPGLIDAVRDYVAAMRALLRKGAADNLFFWSAGLPRLRALADESDPVQRDFLHLDGAWLFEESLELASLRHEFSGEAFDPARVTVARQALGTLLRRMRRRVQPSRYYALVFMDGDKMGDWVSGARALTYENTWHPAYSQASDNEFALADLGFKQRPLGAAMHLALSAGMKHFALDLARPLVEDHTLGKLVYAGGDDAAALVPVTELLALLQRLRAGFAGTKTPLAEPLDPACPGLVQLGGEDGRWLLLPGGTFTASVGVAIVHYSHPLAHAMEAGFKAMKDDAKEQVGRDGYAIHLFKRSGTPLAFGARWQDGPKNGRIDSAELVAELAWAFGSRGYLSRRLPYAVAEIGAGLGTWETDPLTAIDHPLASAATALLKGLLARHSLPGRQADAMALHGKLAPLLRAWYEDAGAGPPAWERLRDLLLLARFLGAEHDPDPTDAESAEDSA
ncbi:type III-B CRISPR-associated protein Cas10/Cmr2 [Thiococcus pfennigii]|uniref:type III-B CRISPR-associated protein Cas10/Cmr2 n=1 Tax=Thiococcus pfennigii TaxID=1057 RepID=UPI00190517E7|nr:type III-B CRISPR-associated protein Cas10/Cmr2 [Thiococcus pfennigii]MBK1700192.1 type III-B CRISPR-associated protein Cas10/Cmr2 [Thiococcus pfennigii]